MTGNFIVIENEGMQEMLKAVFKNSSRAVRKALKPYVWLQRNPLREHYGRFLTVSTDVFLEISQVYHIYLGFNKDEKSSFRLDLERN